MDDLIPISRRDEGVLIGETAALIPDAGYGIAVRVQRSGIAQ
jgi:hypothetical protein